DGSETDPDPDGGEDDGWRDQAGAEPLDAAERRMEVLRRQHHVVRAAPTAGEGKIACAIALRLGRDRTLAVHQLHGHVGEPFLSRLDLAHLAATAGDEIAPDDPDDPAGLAGRVLRVLRASGNLRNRK